MEKNIKHAHDVKTQIEQRSKLLQFIGTAVVAKE